MLTLRQSRRRRLGAIGDYLAFNAEGGVDVDYEGAIDYGVQQGTRYAEQQAEAYVAQQLPNWAGAGGGGSTPVPAQVVPAPPPPPPAPVAVPAPAPAPIVQAQPARQVAVPAVRPPMVKVKSEPPWLLYALVGAAAYALLRA